MMVVPTYDSASQLGSLACPSCGGALRPWGFARWRVTRVEGSEAWWRPRRARCSYCGRTQVLLPALALSRRRDSSRDVGAVLEAYGLGRGYRRVARERRIPVPTARNWIRGLRRRWGHLSACVDPAEGSPHPAKGTTPAGDAGRAVEAVWRAALIAGWSASPWEFASLRTNGSVLRGCNTS